MTPQEGEAREPERASARPYRFAGEGPWTSLAELETPFARVFDVAFAPGTEYDTHRHDEGYVCLIVDGGYDEWPLRSGRRASVTTGSQVSYRAGSAHATRTGEHGARILHVAHPCSPAMVEHTSGATVGILWQLVRVIDRWAEGGGDDADELQAACLTTELWGDAAAPVDGASLDRLRDAVRETYSQRLTLEDLARTVDRHPAHVARAFRARWGMTVGEYVRRIRVAEAVLRLRTTHEALSAVAYHSGLPDQSHMGRWVRRYTGVTPLAVREGRIAARVDPPRARRGCAPGEPGEIEEGAGTVSGPPPLPHRPPTP